MPEVRGAYSKLSAWDRCVVVGHGRGGRGNGMRRGGKGEVSNGVGKGKDSL